MTRVKLDMDVIALSHVNLDAIPGRTKGNALVRARSGSTYPKYTENGVEDPDASDDPKVSSRVRNHWYSGH